MILAIAHPYFFPYIGYFQVIYAAEKFVICDDANYINRGWMNRNRLLIADKPHYFTIPVKKSSSLPTNLVTISNEEHPRWQKKITKTLHQYYRHAINFDDMFPIIEYIILQEEKFLYHLAISSIKIICNYLDITTPIVETTSIYNNKNLKRESRVIDICKQEKCKVYINSIGGKKIYSKENFKKNEIDIKFLQPNEIKYKQFSENFFPSLSIIDVLMHNKKENVKEYLQNFQLL